MKNVKSNNWTFIVIVLSFVLFDCNAKPTKSIIPVTYKIVWNTSSKDALESMPLAGRKGAGANVWVQDGSIWIYLAHNSRYVRYYGMPL